MIVHILDSEDSTVLTVNDWYEPSKLLPITIENTDSNISEQINLTKKDVYMLMIHLQNRLNQL